jgi:hypothetical protein
MAKTPPGESGGRRRVNRDQGSPRTGDGRTRGARIQGSDVSFRTSGGAEVGHGGFAAKLIRRVMGGRHQGH